MFNCASQHVYSLLLLMFGYLAIGSILERFLKLLVLANSRSRLRAVYENFGFQHHSDRLFATIQI
jgi:hypothetical protein